MKSNQDPKSPNHTSVPVSRREVLKAAAAVTAGVTGSASAAGVWPPKAAGKGRINLSVAHWCFEKYWSVEEAIRIADRLGCKSVELVDPKYWPMLKERGMVCALYGSHWFDKGMNNPKYQQMCIDKMKASIDACSEWGFPNVITFTGSREDIPDDVGMANCVAGYKKIIGYAEKKKVNLCLEVLNSRVDEEMKGHPPYQGDHTDYCAEIVWRVGSPNMKLLFDIYHVQVMDGDIISRIRQHADLIGHYHVAGNPGRNEIDDTQEINHPPIMEAIVETGYNGYVGIEFMPTRDPLKSLRQAVKICSV